MANDEMEPFSGGKPNKIVITPQQIDAIGEILNISMGSAATAVSTMLDRQVVITTPKVSVRQFQMVDLKAWEPAMLVRIKYIEGISGTNMMVFHKNDVQMIINLLMGIDTPPSDDFEFDELSMSAACEVMNQMMGSAATAMSNFFDKRIDISTPESDIMETESEFRDIIGIDAEEDIVSISFKMTIPGVLDTEFINIMQCDLVRSLAMQALGDNAEAEAAVIAPATPSTNEAPAPQIYQEPTAPPPVAPQQQPSYAQQEPPIKQPAYAPPPEPIQQPAYAPPPEPQQQPAYVPPQQMPQQMQQQYYAPPQQMQQQPQVYQAPPMQQQVSQPHVQLPQFPDFSSRSDSLGSAVLNSNMDLMMGLPLTVSVEIGKTSKKIKDIMDFTQGTIIELEKQAGAPVDIVVNGHLIARGDVVVIDDNFGVRITEIIRTKDFEF